MAEEKIIEIQVEGMTCTNCAATVRRKLEKDGMTNVNVDFASGEVSFTNNTPLSVIEISQNIDDLGYHVVKVGQDEKKNY